MSIEKLLDHHGFSSHPFSTWIAEDEGQLVNWFVAPSFMNTLVGRSSTNHGPKPISSVVLGAPGIGKTAIRRILEAQLRRSSPDSLILSYTDFTNPLAEAPDLVPSLGQHVEELIRIGTLALIAFWAQDAQRYEDLDPAEKAELSGLVARYYSALPKQERERYVQELSPRVGKLIAAAKGSGKRLVELYNGVISILNKEKIEPVQWPSPEGSEENPNQRFLRFWELAAAMGASDIRILVDRVDEAGSINTPHQIFGCVRELLLSNQFMELRQGDRRLCGVTVFLSHPEMISSALRDAGFRPDRINLKQIRWRRHDLEAALVRRLDHFSAGSVNSFSQLCDETARDAHEQIVDAAALRPRTLFRICAEIFTEFGESRRTAVKFSRDDVEAGIAAGLEAVVG